MGRNILEIKKKTNKGRWAVEKRNIATAWQESCVILWVLHMLHK